MLVLRSGRSDRNLFAGGFRIVNLGLITNRCGNGPDANFHGGFLLFDAALIANRCRNSPNANLKVLLARILISWLILF
jgi:hypothetical protein